MVLTEQLLGELFEERAMSYGASPAITYKNRDYSYEDMLRAIDGFGAELQSRGVKPGDHVALWSYNSAQWLIAYFAIIKVGAVAVLYSYSLPITDLTGLMSYTDCKFLVFGNNRELRYHEDAIKRIQEELGLPNSAILDIRDQSYSLDMYTDSLTPVVDNCRRTAVMMFTSGTTAEPKAVELSQYNLTNINLAHSEILDSLFGEKSLPALPFFHSFGLLVVTTNLLRGMHVFVVDAIKPDAIIDLIYQNQITDLYSVSSVFLNLIEDADFNKRVAPFITACIIGGSLAQASHLMKMEAAFYNATFANGYGQTEASPGISMSIPGDSMEQRIATVGRPFPGEDVRITDGKGGFLLPYEVGEIVVRGYNVMNGYYKLPPDMQAVDGDGWLHTGDLGFFDEEGYLHFAGRLKDIIIRNGENITPAEIEAELLKRPEIKNVRVYGAPHPIWGESVEACLILEEGSTLDEEAVRASLKLSLAPFKIPSHFFCYDSFPMNVNGKLADKELLADMLIRLRKLNIDKNLTEGILVTSMVVKNLPFNIESTADMLQSIAENLDFEGRKVRRICHATRAWMTERIQYSSQDVENIKIDVIFRKDALRVRFSDSGVKFNLEKNRNKNPNLIRILDSVDEFTVIEQAKCEPLYCMDFIYDQDFDIEKYLLHHGSDGRGI